MGVTLLGKGKLQKEEPCGPGFTHLNHASVNPSILERKLPFVARPYTSIIHKLIPEVECSSHFSALPHAQT